MIVGGSPAFLSSFAGGQQLLGKPEFRGQGLMVPTLGRLLGRCQCVNPLIVVTGVFALALRMAFLRVVENLIPGQT